MNLGLEMASGNCFQGLQVLSHAGAAQLHCSKKAVWYYPHNAMRIVLYIRL